MEAPDISEGPPDIDDNARQNSLHAVFATFDTDNDGYLSPEELALLLMTLCDGLRVSDEELNFVIAAHDTTGKGKLQFTDFASFMLSDTLNYVVASLTKEHSLSEGEPSDIDNSVTGLEPGAGAGLSPAQPSKEVSIVPVVTERKKLHRVPGVGTLRKNRPEDKNNHPDAVADMEEHSASNVFRRGRDQDEEPVPAKIPDPIPVDNLESPAQKVLPEWSVEDTIEWLLGLGSAYVQYEEQFRSNGVDGKLLVELSDSDLPLLGVENRLHIKKILTEIDSMCMELGFTPKKEYAVPDHAKLLLSARSLSNCSLEELQESDAIVDTVQNSLLNLIKQLRQDINFDFQNPQHV